MHLLRGIQPEALIFLFFRARFSGTSFRRLFRISVVYPHVARHLHLVLALLMVHLLVNRLNEVVGDLLQQVILKRRLFRVRHESLVGVLNVISLEEGRTE